MGHGKALCNCATAELLSSRSQRTSRQMRTDRAHIHGQNVCSNEWCVFAVASKASTFADVRDFSNVLMGAAYAVVYHEPSITALTDAATPQLSSFSEQGLANIAWALARLRHRNPTFMRQLLSEAVGRQEQLQPQAAANLMYAAAVLVCWEGVEGLASLGQHQAGGLTEQNVANIAWSHAVMGVPWAETQWLARLVAQRAAAGDFKLDGHRQQLCAYLHWLVCCGAPVPPQLERHMADWAAGYRATCTSGAEGGLTMDRLVRSVLRVARQAWQGVVAPKQQPADWPTPVEMAVRQQGQLVPVVVATGDALSRTVDAEGRAQVLGNPLF